MRGGSPSFKGLRAGNTHPTAATHTLSEHGLPSSHGTGTPRHSFVAASHASRCVQTLPSSHDFASTCCGVQTIGVGAASALSVAVASDASPSLLPSFEPASLVVAVSASTVSSPDVTSSELAHDARNATHTSRAVTVFLVIAYPFPAPHAGASKS